MKKQTPAICVHHPGSLLFAVLSICAQSICAANISDAAFIEYRYTPSAPHRITSKDETSSDITSSEYDIKTKFAIPLYAVTEARPVFVFLNINYELLSCDYEFKGNNITLNSIDMLHSMGSGIGAYVSLKDGLSMAFNVGGSLNTNLNKVKKVDQKDLSVNGNVVFIRTNKTTSYQYGITTSSSFGRPMILPIAGFSWKPAEWFQYSVLIPHQTSAWFLGEKISIGLIALVDGMQYRLIRNDQANNYTLSRSTVESDIALRYKIWKNVNIYSELSYLLKQTITVQEPDNSAHSEIEFSGGMADRFSVRFGIAFSPQ